MTPTSSVCFAPSPVERWQAWSASSVISTSPRKRSRKPSRSPYKRWPEAGLPPSPAGWIITTARNRGIDRVRREASRNDRQQQALLVHTTDEHAEVGPVEDDRLRLIFTCCHPALGPEAQVALTLRLIAGLQTPEIARALLVSEPTMAQRLVRAKSKIRAANIPYQRARTTPNCPTGCGRCWPSSTSIFNEGHVATSWRRAWSATTCAAKRSGSPGCWSS